ncbi:hypothetical protein BV25DRAFT_1920145 [Artomyces pyxidatus]|uniref:Uncharacterized protein n=1 Tax=Artomyces pyxidatus TaxID=48021 RepID=A0ACB8SNT2_9AGAM|nr:hypothetical protein BV25DRAFT_1920145 [Artomyces pyxidatus]
MAARAGAAEGVEVKVDYVEMNDPGTFEVLGEEAGREEAPVVLNAAVWVGRTRLIDNIVLEVPVAVAVSTPYNPRFEFEDFVAGQPSEQHTFQIQEGTKKTKDASNSATI